MPAKRVFYKLTISSLVVLLFLSACLGFGDYGGHIPYLTYQKGKDQEERRVYFRNINRIRFRFKFDSTKNWKEMFQEQPSFFYHLESKFKDSLKGHGYPNFVRVVETNEPEDAGQPGALLDVNFVFGKPAMFCEVRKKPDFAESARKLSYEISRLSDPKIQALPETEFSLYKLTGTRVFHFPVRIELRKTGEASIKTYHLKTVSEFENEIGNQGCPPFLDSLSNAIPNSANQISMMIFPDTKVEWMRIFDKSDDPEIDGFLKLGFQQVTGESWNIEKAKLFWEEADRIAKGKSWEALSNLGAYYFMIGYREEAIRYLQRAMEIGGSPKSYLKGSIEMVRTIAILESSDRSSDH